MGLLSKVGDFLNDITGVTSSARRQMSDQMKLQQDAQNFAKWQMGNAHQQEVADLQAAGLNPVLSSGGGGASAGVSQGSASVGVNADPIGMISNIINTINNSAKTNADIKNSTEKTKAEVNKLLKDAGFTEKQIEYYNEHGVFPGANITTSQSTPWGSSSETVPVGIKTQSTARGVERQREKIKTKKKYPTDKKIGNNGDWWY